MDTQKRGTCIIIKTIIAMVILLSAFFIQGAVVVVGGLDGIESVLVRGSILWGLALATITFYSMKQRSPSMLGFHKTKRIYAKRLFYFVPLTVIALAPFSWGIDADIGIGMIFANLFLALGIGFCEEIYFRGIILKLLLKKGEKAAIIVSSVLFAVCHLMNLAGGSDIVGTILQMCFAFVYGIVFALIFIICRSIWPCILLHSAHDFCSFISAERSISADIVLGSIQFAILLCYAVIIIKIPKNKTASRNDRAA